MSTAEELGATLILMDARLGLAELYRQKREHERARRIYESYLQWAERQGVFEGAIFALLGLAHLAINQNDLHAAHGYASEAVTHLNKVPAHWLWATYRLVVATLLAKRGDELQTWQWLWSASELGLADTVDSDAADCLELIRAIAQQRGWSKVLRLASKLAESQRQRLGPAHQPVSF